MIDPDPRLLGAAVVVWTTATVGGYGTGTLLASLAFDPIMAGAAGTAIVFVVANVVVFLLDRGDGPDLGGPGPGGPEGPRGVIPRARR